VLDGLEVEVHVVTKITVLAVIKPGDIGVRIGHTCSNPIPVFDEVITAPILSGCADRASYEIRDHLRIRPWIRPNS
jgi:hypothetical protein